MASVLLQNTESEWFLQIFGECFYLFPPVTRPPCPTFIPDVWPMPCCIWPIVCPGEQGLGTNKTCVNSPFQFVSPESSEPPETKNIVRLGPGSHRSQSHSHYFVLFRSSKLNEKNEKLYIKPRCVKVWKLFKSRQWSLGMDILKHSN